MSSLPRVVILGAGPAGLGAAYRLRKDGKAEVTVLEAGPRVGGNSGGFFLHGIPVDYGSHRLHPSCEPDILQDIRSLLGQDLLDRPRHGRIRLMGRWIHFPLKPLDLLLRMPPRFALGVLGDAIGKRFRRADAGAETFATVLQAGLGRTICSQFYFPYARKIWGEAPETLSPIQARRRVSADSLWKMFRRVLNMVPGFKPPGAGRFFYPREGFGQIARAYHDAASRLGAEFRLGTAVTEVRALWPAAPAEVVAASQNIRFRAMVLAYLVLPTRQFTEFDAHYFPEAEVPMTRLSEPRNYCALQGGDQTVLCAELPCAVDDAIWTADPSTLGALVCDGLRAAGLPVPARIVEVKAERLRAAYPIYDRGYERWFDAMDQWLLGLPRLLSFGRQGLFAHDNTHHALNMAYRAVECLQPDGTLDRPRWLRCREAFRTHVVED